MSEEQSGSQEGVLVEPATAESSGKSLKGPLALDAAAGWRWTLDAMALFGNSPWMWILLLIVYVVLSSVASLVPFFGSAAFVLFNYVLLAGLMIACRDSEQGKEVQVEHLFAAFRRDSLGQLVLCGAIVFGLSIAVVILVAIIAVIVTGGAALAADADAYLLAGSLSLMAMLTGLFAMALVIPIAMMAWFAPVLIVFHGLPVWDAMKMSFKGCLKNILPFLVWGLVMLVFSIAAIIPLGLGLLVLMPVSMICMYTSYKMIFTAQP